MRNIKDFQARYDRWKNGERYWDIRGVDLPKYDTADKNTDQEYIFQRPDGTYYSSPTNSSAFTEDVTPVLKRNLSNPATWDFVGSNTNKKYTTQYTDDQLRQMAQDSMPNAEMITWIDRAGNKQRSARIIGLSPADPIGSTVVEFAGGLPAWKALDYAGNKLAIDFARDFAFTKFGNWARNKILSNQLNKNIENAALSASYPHASNILNIMPKRSNGRYQFDSPTYQMYTGPQHDISEIINTDGSVNLRNLLNIQNEALHNIPGGTIARHRLENQKWHPTDWNTFLHTRDAYKRALDNKYPQEALFPTLMHDFGKMWAGDGHGPYGASILQQMFQNATKEQIAAIYQHMDEIPASAMGKLVKGADIAENNTFRDNVRNLTFQIRGEKAIGRQFQPSTTQYDFDDKNSKELIKYLNSKGYDTSILSARDAQDLENIRRASIIDAGINSGKRFGIFSNNSNDWVDLYNKAGSNIGTLSVDANGTEMQNRLAQHTIGMNPINKYYNIDNVPGVHMVRNLTSDWEIPEKGVSKDMYDIFLQAMRQKGNDKGLLSGYRLLQPEKTTAVTSNKNYRTITIPGTGLHDILTPNGRKTIIGDSKILLYPRNPNVAFKSTAFDPAIINESGTIITDFNNPSMYYNYGKNA